MSSFIRRLYNSPRFLKEAFQCTDEYRASTHTLEEAKQMLWAGLTDKQREAFEHVMDSCSDVTDQESDDAFRVGFCVGARLMLEVMAFDEI